MFEGRPRDSCLVSTLFTMPSNKETKWSFLISGKRPFLNNNDDESDLHNHHKKKIHKLTDFLNRNRGDDVDDCSAAASDDGENGSSDSGTLIPGMNKDDSITCLIRCSRADYCSIASVNRSLRALIRSGEIYRLRRLQGTLEHWVYFSCHLNEWEAFDPRSKRWMHLPSMPQNECFRYADKESLAVGTDLLVFGWEVSSYVIYRYSLLTNSWSTGKSMNMPRCLFGSASYGEIAVLAGGCDSSGRILDTAEMYNYEDQTWSVLPGMNKRRKMCSGVFMDGKFYVIGGIGVGEGNEPKVLTCGEEFDLKTSKWREIPEMSPPRSSSNQNGNGMSAAAMAPPLVAVVDDQLYAADHAGMAVRRYDKERRVWRKVGNLPEQAGSMNGWGLAFRACGDRVVVIGGPKAPGEGFIELNSWVPSDAAPEWHLLGKKQSVNFVYNCAVMSC